MEVEHCRVRFGIADLDGGHGGLDTLVFHIRHHAHGIGLALAEVKYPWLPRSLQFGRRAPTRRMRPDLEARAAP